MAINFGGGHAFKLFVDKLASVAVTDGDGESVHQLESLFGVRVLLDGAEFDAALCLGNRSRLAINAIVPQNGFGEALDPLSKVYVPIEGDRVLAEIDPPYAESTSWWRRSGRFA